MSNNQEIEQTFRSRINAARAIIRTQQDIIHRNRNALKAIQIANGESVGSVRMSKAVLRNLNRLNEDELKFKAWLEARGDLDFTAQEAGDGSGIPSPERQKARRAINRAVARGEVDVVGSRLSERGAPAKLFRKKVIDGKKGGEY